jgi:hypothetical protein
VDISALVEQALDIFDCELKIVDMEWTHPEGRTVVPPESTSEPLVLWGGSVNDLIEHHIGPQAAGLLRNPLTHKPMNFTEVCGIIERIYGIAIGNPSDRRGTVLDRQDNTAFADEMRKVYLVEADTRNSRPSRR